MTISFFLIVNTVCFWEGQLGLLAFPTFFVLFAIYLGLGIALARQMYFLVKEKLSNKKRLINTGLLAFVLILTFLKPKGLIDFEKFEREDLLIAKREGVANCTTTLKLKNNFTFIERRICFGVTEVKGSYHVQNDTIYFDNVNIGRSTEDFYKFATVKKVKFEDESEQYYLMLHKGLTDTLGYELVITKQIDSCFLFTNKVSLLPLNQLRPF